MSDEDGYCEHGTYVGGCGIDWMCGWCEDGISYADYLWILRNTRINARVKREAGKMNVYRALRSGGATPEEIAGFMKHFQI
jgi:hypothetical protein